MTYKIIRIAKKCEIRIDKSVLRDLSASQARRIDMFIRISDLCKDFSSCIPLGVDKVHMDWYIRTSRDLVIQIMVDVNTECCKVPSIELISSVGTQRYKGRRILHKCCISVGFG